MVSSRYWDRYHSESLIADEDGKEEASVDHGASASPDRESADQGQHNKADEADDAEEVDPLTTQMERVLSLCASEVTDKLQRKHAMKMAQVRQREAKANARVDTLLSNRPRMPF